jgi:hypothetical protein
VVVERALLLSGDSSGGSDVSLSSYSLCEGWDVFVVGVVWVRHNQFPWQHTGTRTTAVVVADAAITLLLVTACQVEVMIVAAVHQPLFLLLYRVLLPLMCIMPL